MTALFAVIALRWRRWLDATFFTSFVLAALASLPFLLGALLYALSWLCELFHRSNDLWKECPRCF